MQKVATGIKLSYPGLRSGVGKLMRKVFFGQLRAAEFEHLMERSWYAVTETCLAFTVFK